MSETVKDDKIFIPGSKKNIVPFMRDVFTIPTSARQKPNLIGSVCMECEEYFFPKTGQKATCDNPFCPRSTKETLLSGRGKILSATVTRSSVEGEDQRVSSVILLEEGIKVNSSLIGWEGFQYLLVPGTSVEVVLQEMGETDEGDVIVGYAFRLVIGRKKPQFPSEKDKSPAPKKAGKKKALKGEMIKKKDTKKKVTKEKVTEKEVNKKKAKKLPVKKKVAKKKTADKSRTSPAAGRGKKKAIKKKVAKKKAKVKKKAAQKIKKKAQKKKIPKQKSPVKKAVRKKSSMKSKAKRR